MKATGIVRRVDDLGRVVIPKEIRRTMGVTEGTALEIFVESDGSVIFRKYMPENGLIERIEDIEMVVNDISDDLGDKVSEIQRHIRSLKELCSNSVEE